MSLSTLESLPNEILFDIIEKYINGVDIITAFNYHLNQHFDQVIVKCRRMRFNFIRCSMNDFRFCMDLLPAYLDKIEELAISDEGTPGQVRTFLSVFPSFTTFTRLRKIYIYFSSELIDWNLMQRALLSLSSTSIESLSIETEEKIFNGTWQTILHCLLPKQTLREVCLLIKSDNIVWKELLDVPSNIEYFIAPNIRCSINDLQYLLKWTPRLKYLHINMSNPDTWESDDMPILTECQSIQLTELQTLILICINHSIKMDDLASYFDRMPRLNRLEMTVSIPLLDQNAWEILLTRSLPLLKHFVLRTCQSMFNLIDIGHFRSLFQNIWTLRPNFRLITTKDFDDNLSHWSRLLSNRYRYDIQRSPLPYSIILNCNIEKDAIVVDNDINILSSAYIDTLPCHYYFNNVKYLTVVDLKPSTLNWILIHVNCSRISELVVKSVFKYTEELTSLLLSTQNKTSLHIRFQTLLAFKDVLINKENCLKRLDISANEHPFNEEDISTIAQLFPHLEHLITYTDDLHNIPLLKIYLPHLNSFTYDLRCEDYVIYPMRYDIQFYSKQFRETTDFFFQFKDDCITIWMNDRVYEHSYWKKFPLKSRKEITISRSRNISHNPTRNSTSSNRTIIHKLFSFLKISKK